MDKDRFISLLNDFGVPFSDGGLSDEDEEAELRSVFIQHDGEKVVGYSGSCFEFIFDKKGNFVKVGVWE